jgi:hypothetical protein
MKEQRSLTENIQISKLALFPPHFSDNKFYTPIRTHSMQQSASSETNRFSASQEIPRILWNTKLK